MFIENVARNLIQICNERNLTEEKAAELCKISCRYFNKIICKQPNISIKILEKICIGLNVTSDELLYINKPSEEMKACRTVVIKSN